MGCCKWNEDIKGWMMEDCMVNFVRWIIVQFWFWVGKIVLLLLKYK